jgi:hypothetical protein
MRWVSLIKVAMGCRHRPRRWYGTSTGGVVRPLLSWRVGSDKIEAIDPSLQCRIPRDTHALLMPQAGVRFDWCMVSKGPCWRIEMHGTWLATWERKWRRRIVKAFDARESCLRCGRL